MRQTCRCSSCTTPGCKRSLLLSKRKKYYLLTSPLRTARLELSLVDHNRLSTSQRGLAGSVRRVVDHHDPESALPNVVSSTIEPVGSCATLVARESGLMMLNGCSIDELLM